MNFNLTTLAESLAAYLAPVLPGVQMLEDPAQQGVQPPCMFIQQRGESRITALPGGYFQRTIPLDLTYLQEYNLSDLRQRYNAAAETLDFCMDTFPYSDGSGETKLLRAYDRTADIDDEVLHYKFELRVFVKKPVETVKMQTQTVNQKVDT